MLGGVGCPRATTEDNEATALNHSCALETWQLPFWESDLHVCVDVSKLAHTQPVVLWKLPNDATNVPSVRD